MAQNTNNNNNDHNNKNAAAQLLAGPHCCVGFICFHHLSLQGLETSDHRPKAGTELGWLGTLNSTLSKAKLRTDKVASRNE